MQKKFVQVFHDFLKQICNFYVQKILNAQYYHESHQTFFNIDLQIIWEERNS